MDNLKSIILCYSNHFEEQYFRSISLHYAKLFHFELIESTYFSKEIRANGVFSFSELNYDIPTLLFSQEVESNYFYAKPEELWETKDIFLLNDLLFDFKSQLDNTNLMSFFPNDLVIEDSYGTAQVNHLLNPYFFENTGIDDWIKNDSLFLEKGQIHFLEPNDSFDQIMMDSYYLLRDNDEQIKGYAYQKQDIKPILKSYLDETAQALVGWSDVVSGASIKNEEF